MFKVFSSVVLPLPLSPSVFVIMLTWPAVPVVLTSCIVCKREGGEGRAKEGKKGEEEVKCVANTVLFLFFFSPSFDRFLSLTSSTEAVKHSK
jgi:hypothetical protein